MKFINIFPSNYQGLPEKALAELSTPLYEKVVCNIPFLVMDKSRKLVSKDRLSKLRYINMHVIKAKFLLESITQILSSALILATKVNKTVFDCSLF